MKKNLFFAYGLLCYILGIVTFIYLIGFIGNILVPKSIDAPSTGRLWPAAPIDLLLIASFGIQHSLMARPTFKRWWTKIVPKPLERSTYVLFAAFMLGLIFWQWRSLPTVVWQVQATWARWLLWGIFGLGWIIVLVSTELIDSKQLFGLRQVSQYRKREHLTGPEFQTPIFYRYVRHPLLLGFLIAFWATTRMTIGHLLFAVAMTVYVLFAIPLEERNLIDRFGDRYRQYRKRVPMLIPWLTLGSPEEN